MKKKFFVVAASLALTMAVTCPAMADVVTGSTDAEKTVTTDGWWKDFSDYYKLSGNFDVTFTIDNKGGTANWNNPSLVVTTDADRGAEGYSEYAVVRMDAYGWGTASLGYNTNGWNWDTFAATMQDVEITYNVKRVNNSIDVHAVMVGANGITQTYDININDYFNDDLRLFFAADTCTFTIKNYTVNAAPAETDASYVLKSAGWWQEFSPYYSYTGDFTRSFHIKNSGGAAQWNNPIFAVTNDVARAGTGYTEYSVARCDAYSVAGGDNTTYNGTYTNYSWEDITAILADADIYLTVTRSGNTVTFANEVNGANGKSYTYNVVVTNDSLPKTIRFFLSTDTASMSVYEDSKDVTSDTKTYAQYKKVSDNNYTVRIVSEVAMADVTKYANVGFRCSKLATKAGENYYGMKVYKSIKANGKTVTAADGKYFVILEINNVVNTAKLYAEPVYQDVTMALGSFGKEVTVDMASLLK